MAKKSSRPATSSHDHILSFMGVAYPALYELVTSPDESSWGASERELRELYGLDKSSWQKDVSGAFDALHVEWNRKYLLRRQRAAENDVTRCQANVNEQTMKVAQAEQTLRAMLPPQYAFPENTHNYEMECDALWLKTYHEQSWWKRVWDPARTIMSSPHQRQRLAALWGIPMNQKKTQERYLGAAMRTAGDAHVALTQFQYQHPLVQDFKDLHTQFVSALLSWSQWPAVIAAAQHSYTVRPKPSSTPSGIGYPSRAPSPQRTSASSPSSRRRYDDDASPSWSPSPSPSTWDSWSSSPSPAPSESYRSGGGGDFGGGGASGGWDSGGSSSSSSYSSSDSGSSCGSSD